MSIQSEISRIAGNIASAYTALSAKGATMPSAQNTANLAGAIESIAAGEAMSIETIRAICYVPSDFEKNYTQLSYIQSSGTQYIDTNYIPASENLKIYAKFAISKIQSWKSMFGSENGANGLWSLIAITNDSSKLVFYTGTSAMVGSIPVSAGQVYELTCQTANGTLTYNCGSTTGSVAVSGSVNKAQTLYVFTQHSHSASNTANQAISMKLYDCKIYDNGTLVRDFVPCKNSNGVFGMYDMVNEQFYANAGSGSFTGA
jgi:hypothetical protein